MGTHNHFLPDPFDMNEASADDQPGRSGRGRRGRGPRGRGPGGHGPGGRGRERSKRGAAASGVLLILAERAPLHGYELITELEERSEGRWRPSPGSMYPALGRLEEKGLIAGAIAADGDGKKSYELTDDGRAWLDNRDPDAPPPWDEGETGPSGGLRPLVSEVMSATKQIGRFGTDEQRQAAAEVLGNAKSELYKILASNDAAE